jgi:hypothetical protein
MSIKTIVCLVAALCVVAMFTVGPLVAICIARKLQLPHETDHLPHIAIVTGLILGFTAGMATSLAIRLLDLSR